MAGDADLERASWRHRSPEFGALCVYDDGRPIVVMELEPADRAALAEWMWLRHQWLELPPHPNLLDAVDRGDGGKLLVRYAAIDWRRRKLVIANNVHARKLAALWPSSIPRMRRAMSTSPSCALRRCNVWAWPATPMASSLVSWRRTSTVQTYASAVGSTATSRSRFGVIPPSCGS